MSVKALAFQQRQSGKSNRRDVVIDLDAMSTPPPAPQPARWVANLTADDKDVLLSGAWLNDALINVGQELIKQTHPHVAGLQNVELGRTLSFDVKKDEFVQVLHNGSDHWVTVSTIGCGPAEVDIFDSLSPALTGSLERQLAALLCTDHQTITVKYVRLIIYLHAVS